MKRMTSVVTMVARSLVDCVHALTKDSAVPMRSCASIVLVLLESTCSAVAMGGGLPISSFDELLTMAVLTASWLMLLMADL